MVRLVQPREPCIQPRIVTLTVGLLLPLVSVLGVCDVQRHYTIRRERRVGTVLTDLLLPVRQPLPTTTTSPTTVLVLPPFTVLTRRLYRHLSSQARHDMHVRFTTSTLDHPPTFRHFHYRTSLVRPRDRRVALTTRPMHHQFLYVFIGGYFDGHLSNTSDSTCRARLTRPPMRLFCIT